MHVLDMISATVIHPGQVQLATFQIAMLLTTALVKETVFFQTRVCAIRPLMGYTAIKRQKKI